MINTPIFYMGNKQKLIKKGLIDLFPNNIETFIDLFCGSGIVSMNVEANNYFMNDFNKNLIDLFNFFKYNNSKDILKDIDNIIVKYELEKGKTNKISFDNRSKNYDKELSNFHKEKYAELRDEYNKTKNVLLLYCLLIYCFCHQMRFNSNNDFNMPCGNGIFTKENREWIINSSDFFNKNINFVNYDFRKLNPSKLNNNDFVYLDPPYLGTDATYNENDGWNIKDELDLYSLCENLDKQGIKWGMSNVFKNKNKINNTLIEWCEKNNWNIYHFDEFTYSACGKGNSNTEEVFIYNY